MVEPADRVQAQTIADFGEQWTAYPDADGYFGSVELFNDTFAPVLSDRDVAGKRVAEIGAGIGRFVNILARAGASHVIALEPSSAFEVLLARTAGFKDRITYLQRSGEQIPEGADLDYIFMIGVLHHIPDPDPVVRASHRALRPGGMLAVWIYGREGNGAYLMTAGVLRSFTRRLPHRALEMFVAGIYAPFWIYMMACRWLPLPLAQYMRRVILPLTPAKRRVVIYDQLNPAYAKYYTRQEAEDVLARNGFEDVRLHHRHGYSWTVVGTRPKHPSAEASP
jgi:2-polyprenyl-3-methyl-5-hydroxy-6-metoxy-1,4-benzoquinol methylase